jgi:hypothetical protein
VAVMIFREILQGVVDHRAVIFFEQFTIGFSAVYAPPFVIFSAAFADCASINAGSAISLDPTVLVPVKTFTDFLSHRFPLA